MSNNSNLDENMMNNIKNMVDNGNISGAISQISPEMIQNFSKLMQNSNSSTNKSSSNSSNSSTNTSSNFNLNNLDMDTIMKIGTALNQMNAKDDPRANLLYSLKPYLRDEKKGKLDQYANLLNISKIANILNNDKKENN